MVHPRFFVFFFSSSAHWSLHEVWSMMHIAILVWTWTRTWSYQCHDVFCCIKWSGQLSILTLRRFSILAIFLTRSLYRVFCIFSSAKSKNNHCELRHIIQVSHEYHCRYQYDMIWWAIASTQISFFVISG